MTRHAYVYRCYGLVVGSALPLPELGDEVPQPGRPVDVVVTAGPVGPPPPDAARLPHGLWRDAQACGVSVPDVARYEARGGTHLTVDAAPGAEARDVRLFLLGTMMGALMMQRRHLVLHGNAVRVGDAVAVVVGHSGAGKSTLAAEFARRGLDLLSDDVVPVDGDGMALPGYPRIKLWDDALETLGIATDSLERVSGDHPKFHLPVARGDLVPLPLRWVYALETHDGPTLDLQHVSGVDTFEVLREHTYRPELVHDEDARWQHLQQCAAVAGRAHVVRVVRPRASMTARATADAILADIGSRAGRHEIQEGSPR